MDEKLVEEVAHKMIELEPSRPTIGILCEYDRYKARELIALVSKRVQPEWVSVEDRLPEDESYVQGYCDGEFTKVYLGEVCYCNGEWIIFNENKDIFMVTHWQPLSAPPQENK